MARLLSGFELGQLSAAADSSVSLEKVAYERGVQEVALRAHPNGVAPFWCRVGQSVFEMGDRADSFARSLLKVAAERTEFDPAVQRLAAVVRDAVLESQEQMKVAGIASAASNKVMLPLFARSAALTPDIVRTILAGSVMAGAATGATAYTLNQATAQDDESNESKKRRIRYYQNLADEIQAKMQMNGVL